MQGFIQEVKNNNLSNIQCLLSQVDNHTLNQGLIIACKHGYLDIVRYLLTNGANIHTDGISQYHGDDFPLIVAASEGHLDVVCVLVNFGANIYTWNCAPYRYALDAGHHHVANYLSQSVPVLTNFQV